MPSRDREGERGQILVLFTLVIVLIMGLVALVVDVGVLRGASQNLWNALDAGALAGASQLPADATNADTMATTSSQTNYPGGDPPSNITVSFRCVIGSDGQVVPHERRTYRSVCDPGSNVTWRSERICVGSICAEICVPSEGDICNTIVLSGGCYGALRVRPRHRSQLWQHWPRYLCGLQGTLRVASGQPDRYRHGHRPDVEHVWRRHDQREECRPGGAPDPGSHPAMARTRDARPDQHSGLGVRTRSPCPRRLRARQPTSRPMSTSGSRSA